MPRVEIRPARPEDRDAVLAFCAHTWDWGDYIEYVWDEWLHDPNGVLLVATVDGKPVGIDHLRMLTATDAWLEGLRVDPAYRHQGLAKALNQALLAEAMKRGATVARLLTESTNTASIHMTEQNFWRRVGTFAPFRAAPVTTLPQRYQNLEMPQPATAADTDDIINYLNNSNVFPVTGGLYYEGFTAYAITADLIAQKISAGQVYLLRRWDRLDGLAFVEQHQGRQEAYLFIGYIDGTTDSISLIAYALRRKASEMSVDSVRANVPDMMMVRDAFVGAEYEWDGHLFYTYERSLV